MSLPNPKSTRNSTDPMPSVDDADKPPTPFLLALVNALPSVFWSLLGFLPVSVFCYRLMERRWIYGCVAVAFLAYLVPASLLRHFEWRANPALYRRLGVRWANGVTQHGGLVNRFLRKKNSRYRRLRSRADALSLIRATYMNERFHWAALVFFLLSSLYAAIHQHFGWAALIAVTNVFYNLYPIWLQQYLRIRLERYLSGSASGTRT